MQPIKSLVLTLCLGWPVTAIAQPAEGRERNVTQEDVQRPQGARRVDCDNAAVGRLQRAINAAHPGDTILVSGTCPENVTIPLGKNLITLDGGGVAAIAGPDSTQPTVLVRAKDITIKAFAIAGGFGGIAFTQGGTGQHRRQYRPRYWQLRGRRQSAQRGSHREQYHLQRSSAGIGVAETSYAYIGFVTPTDTVASPNVITGNRQGIAVFRGSYARIVGNDISQNGANGVNVRESSSAQISDNTINGNGVNGTFVAQNSGVLLGADTGNSDLHTTEHDDDQQRGSWTPVPNCRVCRRPVR